MDDENIVKIVYPAPPPPIVLPKSPNKSPNYNDDFKEYYSSNIAKKVFKLEDTSKTFLYIGLAYTPIAFFSLSFFRLLGDYFSLGGSGQYIYLSFTTLI